MHVQHDTSERTADIDIWLLVQSGPGHRDTAERTTYIDIWLLVQPCTGQTEPETTAASFGIGRVSVWVFLLGRG